MSAWGSACDSEGLNLSQFILTQVPLSKNCTRGKLNGRVGLDTASILKGRPHVLGMGNNQKQNFDVQIQTQVACAVCSLLFSSL